MAGRRTRPWGQLKGTNEQNALAAMIRAWADRADLRISDIAQGLTCEHFTGPVPGRSTVAARMAGIGLDREFVEAIADLCTRTASERSELLASAEPLLREHGVATAAADRLAAALSPREAYALILDLEQLYSNGRQLVHLLLIVLEETTNSQQRACAAGWLDRARDHREKARRLLDVQTRRIGRLEQRLDRLQYAPHGDPLPARPGRDLFQHPDIARGLNRVAAFLSNERHRLDELSHALGADGQNSGGEHSHDSASAPLLIGSGFIRSFTIHTRPSNSPSVMDIPALSRKQVDLHPRVTVLVGENNTGKTAVLAAMALLLDVVRSPHTTFTRDQPRDEWSAANGAELAQHLELTRTGQQPDQVHYLATPRPLDPRHDDLCLAPNSLYLLDEPEARWHPVRQRQLLKQIESEAAGSQFIIATHSPWIVDYSDALVLELGDSGIRITTPEEVMRQLAPP
ncbi:putative ATPase [Catenulispora sp. GAS73]|uniref:AAA family ATPase n=1 Tax=Catenulispora sp. GAS73 TaxID=3156269 RepID=UPI0035191331